MIEGLVQPTLVIGNGEDIVHPLGYAEALAAAIPAARLQVIPSKTVDPSGYVTSFRSALADFLEEVPA